MSIVHYGSKLEGDLRRNGIGTKRKNIIATKAIRTLPPVEQCSVAPSAIKFDKPAASTQFVEFFEPQAPSTLVELVEGHTVDVSEFRTHLASCKPKGNEK